MDDELIIDVDYSVPMPPTFEMPMPPSFESVSIPELTPRSKSSYESYHNSPRNETRYQPNEIYYSGRETEEYQENKEYQEYQEYSEEEKELGIYETIQNYAVQYSLVIHCVADFILFYVFFRFIKSYYEKTEQKLEETRESIYQLQRQYGLKRKLK